MHSLRQINKTKPQIVPEYEQSHTLCGTKRLRTEVEEEDGGDPRDQLYTNELFSVQRYRRSED